MLKSRIGKLQSRIYKIVGVPGESVIFITVDSDDVMTACSAHGKGCPSLPHSICTDCHKSNRDTVTFIEDIGTDEDEDE